MVGADPNTNPKVNNNNNATANHGQGYAAQNNKCNHSCKVSAAIIIPIILATCIGFFIYCVWGHKYLATKRDAKRRAQEEKDVEMMKLGDRDEVGSVSDASFVQGVGQPGNAAGQTQPPAKTSRWWHRSELEG